MSNSWAQFEEERRLQTEKRRQKYLEENARLQAVTDANKQKWAEWKKENAEKEREMSEEERRQKDEKISAFTQKLDEYKRKNDEKKDKEPLNRNVRDEANAEYARRRPVKEEKPAKKC